MNKFAYGYAELDRYIMEDDDGSVSYDQAQFLRDLSSSDKHIVNLAL